MSTLTSLILVFCLLVCVSTTCAHLVVNDPYYTSGYVPGYTPYATGGYVGQPGYGGYGGYGGYKSYRRYHGYRPRRFYRRRYGRRYGGMGYY